MTSQGQQPHAHYALIVGVACVLQLGLVSWTFPARELLSETPLFWIDSAYHWYQMTIASDCAAWRRLICYDPSFAAGYPAGVTYNWSAKFPALIAILTSPELDVTQVYKLHSFASAVLGPACIALACWIFRLGIRVALIATALAFLLWWLSILRWYHTAGMVSFVWGSFAAIPYIAGVHRLVSSSAPWRWALGLSLTGAAALFYHPLFAVPVAFAVAGLALAGPTSQWLRRLPFLLAIAGIALLSNLWWLVPMLKAQAQFGINVRVESPYQQTVDLSLLWRELLGQWQGQAHGSKLYGPIAFAAAWACFARNVDAGQRGVVSGLAAGAVALGLFAAVGASIPAIAGMQPNRFLPVVYLLLLIPAAVGTGAIFTALRGERTRERAIAGVSAAVLLLTAGYGGRELMRELSYGNHPHYGVTPPEVKGLGASTVWLERWIKADTDSSARILLETSPGRVIDQTHIFGYLAVVTRREFIGGPYPYAQFANFWDHTAFRREITAYSPTEFETYLRTYNVGWIVAHTPETQAYLAGLSYVVFEAAEGDLKTYRVELPHDYFLKGSGTVVAGEDGQLLVEGATGDEVVLKYHLVDGLQASPPVEITGVRVLDDPNPFIRVARPPATMTLRMR